MQRTGIAYFPARVLGAAWLTVLGLVVLTLVTIALEGAASTDDCSCTCERLEITEEGTTIIDLPAFCTDSICVIYVWYDSSVGAFAGGFFPVYYSQTASGDWIAGPAVSQIAGVGYSAGQGVNGDFIPQDVFGVTRTVEDSCGGTLYIVDDSEMEMDPLNQWSVLWTWPATGTGECRSARRLVIFICPG